MELKYPVLGIDVSKAKLDLCLLTEQGKRFTLLVKNAPSGYQQLAAWLDSLAASQATACLEATNVYSAPIALFLYERAMTVCLANPKAVSAFMHAEMRRAKTDKADAASIANYARAMAETLRPWQPLTPEYEALRDLVRHYRDLKRSKARAKCRREKLGYITSEAHDQVERSINAELEFYAKEIRLLEKAIRACLKAHPPLQKRYKLLTTAPGVAFVTAVTFMAEVPDIRRFAHPKQLAAYAGVTPCIRHSGNHQPESQPISKMGNARLRHAFFMASLSARRYNNAAKACAMHEDEKESMVVQIAVVRKLLHLLYAMEKHQTPYDPNYQKKHQ